MSTFNKMFENDAKMRAIILEDLRKEVNGYEKNISLLYHNRDYRELKIVSHNIKNIAAMFNYLKLKLIASYWESVCDDEREADVNEYKKEILEFVKFINIY